MCTSAPGNAWSPYERRNLSYSVTEKKKEQGHVKKPILSNVSGFAEPGTLTAILGGSALGSNLDTLHEIPE